ncbi:amidohydrolase family protein [Pleomorphovibrio marinus]|uniref:amidohydrolase family protein n=1 Tax=Pleomorphovibrio marinus TaxID=2164132 RepID=UPI000E0A3B48|nr:amidohydrolase family protein [Pleomorphovibrio marinus]
MDKRSFIKRAALGAMAVSLKPTAWITAGEETPIVDTHLHLWDRSVMDYPWLSGILDRDFLVKDFSQATQGIPIKKMVFVECARKPEQYLTEVKWVEERAREDQRIQGMVAYFPLEKGESYRKEMEELAGHKIVRSIRKGVDKELLQNRQFLEGAKMMDEKGLNYDLNIQPDLMKEALSFVRKFPNMQFILNHIANPSIASGQHWEIWKEQLVELSRLDNVNCKVSGMITKADPSSWKVSDLHPYFDHVMNTFGPDRVVYGGDWPVVLRAGSYMDWMQAFLTLTSDLSMDEKELLYFKNAERIYRI